MKNEISSYIHGVVTWPQAYAIFFVLVMPQHTNVYYCPASNICHVCVLRMCIHITHKHLSRYFTEF